MYSNEQKNHQGKTSGRGWNIVKICLLMTALPAFLTLVLVNGAAQTSTSAAVPAFRIPALPYPQNALEPFISARTMSFHYGKHHQAYVDNLNRLTAGTAWAGQTIEKVIMESTGKPDEAGVFNNAAQVWNHNFFWQSMKPGGGGKPAGLLLERIEKSFGSFDEFKTAFKAAAVSQFGSGWAWLIQEGDTLKIIKTSNADTPLAHGQTALLTCDVWEHAYYLDYQNRRPDFVQTFLDHLVNWEFAASQMKP